MEMVKKYLKALKQVTLGTLLLVVVLGAIHFPYDADAPVPQKEVEAARKYKIDDVMAAGVSYKDTGSA